MNEPHIAGKKPAVFEIEPGTYWWCQCGLSEAQPFCDGSHKGTGFSPKELIIEKKQKIALCLCKRSAKSPLCDGTHRTL